MVSDCLYKLRRKSIATCHDEEIFCRQLFEALFNLQTQIADSFIQDAKLTARYFVAPSPRLIDGQRLEYATVIALRAVTDVHGIGVIDPRFEYIPCNFFLCQHRVYSGSPHNEWFAEQVHRDFREMVRRSDSVAQSVSSPRQSSCTSKGSKRGSWSKSSPSIRSTGKWPFLTRERAPESPRDNSSEKSLLNVLSDPASTHTAISSIHVTRTITIDIDRIQEGNSPDIEMTDLDRAKTAKTDNVTYADELLALTIEDAASKPLVNCRRP